MRFFSKIPVHIKWILAVCGTFLIFMTAYRFLFFWNYNPIGKAFSGSSFIMGLRFDLKFVSILGISMLTLQLIPWLNPFKYRAGYFWWRSILPLLFLTSIILYLTDFYFYDYIRQRLNANVLSYLTDTSISMNMAWHTYPVIRVLIALIVAIFLCNRFFTWQLNQFLKRSATANSNKNWPWIVGFWLLFALGIFGKFSQFNLRWSDAFTLSDNFKSNLALNPFQSFFSTFKFRDTRPHPEKAKEFYSVMAEYLVVDHPDSTALRYDRSFEFNDTTHQQPNIVLVICESFSMYRSSMSGNPLNTTPYFNQMTKEGIFFDRCFTPSFPTARGVWATITSLPDVLGDNNRTASRNPELVNQRTIINDFKNYEKLYLIGGDPTWANIKGLLMNNIDGLKLYSQDDFKAQKANVWGIDDRLLLLESNKILAKQQKPFFAIIQTADNHRPYTYPKDGETGFKSVHPSNDSLLKYGFEDDAQFNAFRYTDYCFEQFIEAAKKEAYFKNTIFVFVGDHGMPGNSNSIYPKSWNEYALTREHVPLLFYAPNLLQPQLHHQVVSQLDIMPSLATLAKVDYRTQALGRNIFDTTGKRKAFEFIIDHESGTIGVINKDFYFTKKIKGGLERMVSVVNNDPVEETPYTDAMRAYMSKLTDAYYETARYLLYNNKRK